MLNYAIILSEMMINNTKDFGALVRKKRKNMQLTQSDLAAVSGVGVRFISELENGKETVQFDKALKVAQVLGLKLQLIN